MITDIKSKRLEADELLSFDDGGDVLGVVSVEKALIPYGEFNVYTYASKVHCRVCLFELPMFYLAEFPFETHLEAKAGAQAWWRQYRKLTKSQINDVT